MDLDSGHLQPISALRTLRYVDETPSTNTLALEWIAGGAPVGAVVVADQQTEGRGRLGRQWFAPPNSALLLTYIFYPPPAYASRAAMLGALAVAELCVELGARGVGIKYPNDVQIDGRKVCGILAEAAWHGQQVGAALGIGLNVRVDFTGSPFESSATSLETVLGRSLDRSQVLAQLLARLDFWCDQAASEALFSAWRARLNMIGETIEVNTGSEIVRGTAESVDPSGALIMRDESGAQRLVLAGDFVVYR